MRRNEPDNWDFLSEREKNNKIKKGENGEWVVVVCAAVVSSIAHIKSMQIEGGISPKREKREKTLQ